MLVLIQTGSLIEHQNIKENKKVIKPDDPIKDGFEFNLWTVDGKEYDFNKKVKESFVIKATWKEEETNNNNDNNDETTYIVTFLNEDDEVIKK